MATATAIAKLLELIPTPKQGRGSYPLHGANATVAGSIRRIARLQPEWRESCPGDSVATHESFDHDEEIRTAATRRRGTTCRGPRRTSCGWPRSSKRRRFGRVRAEGFRQRQIHRLHVRSAP